MKFSAFFVRNFQFTFVLFGLLVAIGVNAFLNVPRTEDPVIPIPQYIITALYPGAGPADLEQLVTEPIEDAINEHDDVKAIRTTIDDGVTVINAEFETSVDVDDTYDALLRQVNGIRSELPSDLYSLEVRQASATNVHIVQVALVSESVPYRVLDEAADRLKDRFETVPGVKEGEAWAYPERQVRVALDLEKAAQLGVTPGQVVAALQSDNANIPGGTVDVGARTFSVKTSGNYGSLDEVRRTVVAAGDGNAVYLGDVADVGWGYADLTHLARFNGHRAVFVTATMKEDQNIFKVRDGLYSELDRFERTLPIGVVLERGFDQSQSVRERLSRLGWDFVIAIGLVLLTLLPLGFRASVIVMVSIPLSLAIGMTLLYGAGYSINQLSIVGFVIALGLLVDDSIVVVENITRFLREGYSRREAAVLATKQITVAVIGCTAVLLFAFLPLMVLPGTAGDFIRSLPVAVVFAVLGSLFVSLTIIPFLGSRLLKREESPEGNRVLQLTNRGIEATYSRLLHIALGHPRVTLAAAAALFLASLALIPAIGFSLFPKADIRQFLVQIELPKGASLQETDRATRFVEDVLAARPEVRHTMANVGRGNPQIYYNVFSRPEQANVAEVFAELHRFDAETTPALYDTLRAIFEGYPGARIVLKEFENGPPIEAPIAVRLLGPDLDSLRTLAGRVENLLAAAPGTRDIDNPLRTTKTDLRVDVDAEKAGLFGVPTVEVDRTVRLALAGLSAGRFRSADGEEYDIVVRLPGPDAAPEALARPTPADLDRVYVPAATGAQIPLRQLTTVGFEASPSTISRYNRERSVTVSAYTATGFNTAEVTGRVLDGLDAMDFPDGYRYVPAGEYESREESFGGISTAILLAIFGILAILVLEFKTFKSTLIVASVIPLGVVGGLTALFLSDYTLSFTAAIGFVALLGIEIKTSILLVDFTNELRQEGMPLDEAIEKAGEIRFLPILLTTLTAIGGLTPLAIQGSSLYSPLAVVIIGGLISSTLLARLVTPVMYKLLEPELTPRSDYAGAQVVEAAAG